MQKEREERELFNGWSISYEVFNKMKELIPQGEKLVEFGSGESTPILNKHWDVLSVEHDAQWANKLKGKYNYLKVAIEHNSLGKGYKLNEEQVAQIEQISYILIDGPPSDRRGLAGYKGLFKNAKIIIVDDTHRNNEIELVSLLKDQYKVKEKVEVDSGEKRATILIC